MSKNRVIGVRGPVRQPKHAAIRNAVVRQIESGQLPPGGLVPSESSLAAQYRVSSTTVRRCLNDLETEGYVSRHRGRGTFVSESATIGLRSSLAILCSNLCMAASTPFLRALLIGLEKHVAEDGRAINMYTSDLLNDTDRPAIVLSQLIRRRGVGGLFVISPMPPEWFEALVGDGFPLVSVNVDLSQASIVSVLLDMEKHVEFACDHLFRLGHRRITTILGHTSGSAVEGIAERAQRQVVKMVQACGDAAVDHLRYDYYSIADKKFAIDSLLSRDEGRPTAVIVAEDGVGDLLMSEAQHRGIRVPDELSVVSLEGLNADSTMSSVVTPVANLCWRSSRIMDQLLEGGRPTQIVETLHGEFVTKQTTAAVAGQTDSVASTFSAKNLP